MNEIRQQYADFQDYYHQYKDKIFSFMHYRLNSNTALAEDLTSDVFLKAYEKFDTYNPEFAFSTWLYTIARNTLIDHFRKHKPTQDLEKAQEIPAKHPEASAKLDTTLKVDKVKDALEGLPEFQKDVVLLKHLEDMSTKQIAEITESTEANVRQALSRAVKKLKTLLAFLALLITLS